MTDKQLCKVCKTDKYYIEYIPQYELYRIICVNCGNVTQAKIILNVKVK